MISVTIMFCDHPEQRSHQGGPFRLEEKSWDVGGRGRLGGRVKEQAACQGCSHRTKRLVDSAQPITEQRLIEITGSTTSGARSRRCGSAPGRNRPVWRGRTYKETDFTTWFRSRLASESFLKLWVRTTDGAVSIVGRSLVLQSRTGSERGLGRAPPSVLPCTVRAIGIA
jgi:hypothetical protein